MTGWTEEDIRRQFQRAKKNGWLQTFKNAEQSTVSRLMFSWRSPPEKPTCTTSSVMEVTAMASCKSTTEIFLSGVTQVCGRMHPPVS